LGTIALYYTNDRSDCLLTELPSTAYSCSWHSVVAATLTLEKTCSIIPLSKNIYSGWSTFVSSVIMDIDPGSECSASPLTSFTPVPTATK